MAKCLNLDCSNEVISQEGKRAKKFCSNTCRQKAWQKKKQEDTYIKVTRVEWEEMLSKSTVGVPPKNVNIKVKDNGYKNNPFVNIEKSEDEIVLTRKSDVPLKKIIVKEGEFRLRREDENVFDYGAAKSEWKMNEN